MNRPILDDEDRHEPLHRELQRAQKRHRMARTAEERSTSAPSPDSGVKWTAASRWTPPVRASHHTENYAASEDSPPHDAPASPAQPDTEPTPDDDVAFSLFTKPDVVNRYQVLERTSDAVFTVDRDWRITSWNRAMIQRSGMPPEAALDRTLWDLGHAVLGAPFPAALEARYRHAMETGELVEFLQHAPEPTDRWVEVRLFADADGLSIFMRDVTAREERKQELERQEFLFRRTQELAQIGVWELELGTNALWWSDGIRQIHGVAPDYVPTLEEALDFYHPEDRASIEDAVQEAMETGETYTRRLRILRPDGEQRHVLTRGEVIYSEDGTPQRLRGTFQDVTALERTKRELHRQYERLDMFIRIVAHDIRNPLNVAMAYADFAQETNDLSHFARVGTAHRRIVQLIDDLMVLARSKLRKDDIKPTSIPEVARAAWDNVVVADRGLDIDPALGTIDGNAGLLAELFENLFRNALEHGGPEACVRVGPIADGFYVEDDGPGIPPDEQDSIFDHGYTTNENGTGMGLSIVSEIAAVHGWAVRAADAPSGGARFEFRPDRSGAPPLTPFL